MGVKVTILKPTVIHENQKDDYACHDDVMELTMEELSEINKRIMDLYIKKENQ